MKKQFKAIFFDLDDTLIDTSGFLIREALLHCFKELKLNHFRSFEHFLEAYYAHRSSQPRVDFFDSSTFSPEQTQSLKESFFNFPLPEEIPLINDAKETLKQLRNSYQLHLVTAGNPDLQNEKVMRTGLDLFFSQWTVVDGKEVKTKRQAFSELIEAHGYSPSDILCVGNRRTDEIAAANELGLQTCLFDYGEHAHLQATTPFEEAHFTIKDLKELVEFCTT